MPPFFGYLFIYSLWCCFPQSDRVETIRKHLCTLYSHCSVLGMDFNEVVNKVNSTLTDPEGPRSLSDHTIKNLDAAVQKLRKVKIQRMQKVNDIVTLRLMLDFFLCSCCS